MTSMASRDEPHGGRVGMRRGRQPSTSWVPDFLIIGVSGHAVSAETTTPTTCTRRGPSTSLGRDRPPWALGRGLRVQRQPSELRAPRWRSVAYGFRSLLETLSTIRRDWISAYDDPTRVIVVADSHGTVWAHLALQMLAARGQPIPVEYLVDLDAVSVGWKDDTFSVGVGDRWRDEIAAT